MVKTPLNIHVVWHSDYNSGLVFAKELYQRLSRNLDDTLSRGVGIPIYFHTHKKSSIEFSDSIRNIIIVFINKSSIIDNKWSAFVDDLNRKSDQDKLALLIPVAISKMAFNIKGNITKKNFIRLFEKQSFLQKKRLLIQDVSNEICRFLYGINRISEDTVKKEQNLPVKFFISHAKQDGNNVASQINKYILSETPLKTFFDANDIRSGSYFQDELIRHIKNEDSVLLVIQTDKYSSREWCRIEIVEAKLNNKPLVVLSRLNEGEYRSFPYMANVRTIHRGYDINLTSDEIEDIITETLIETLKFKYQGVLIRHVIDSFSLVIKNKLVLSYPPELLTCLNIKNGTTVFYPEPPLSREEISILKSMNKSLTFLTPSQIPTLNLKPSNTIKVAISISSNEEIEKFGASVLHLKDYMIEISRYLIASNFKVVFGGDLNKVGEDNYLNALIELANTYKNRTDKNEEFIYNYVASYLTKNISKELEADVFPFVKYIKVPKVNLEFELNKKQDLMRAVSLTNMRTKMNNEIDYRISLGGKFSEYSGKYPGVLEEILLAINTKKPIFLIGGFGGVSREVADIICGKDPRYITDEYQYLKNQTFIDKYKQLEGSLSLGPINYLEITNKIRTMSLNDLNNGLSREENIQLFKTKDLTQIITLILKGISILENKKMERNNGKT